MEVRNPGRLPPPLTFDELRGPHRSIPGNPLLARPLYLADYIERMGTGTLDMIRRCVAAGLPEPEFSLTDGFVTTVRRLPPSERLATRLGSDGLASEVQPESGSAPQPESEPGVGDKSVSQLDLDPILQPESAHALQPESDHQVQPESDHPGPPERPSGPEALDICVLQMFAGGPRSKAALSADLGQRTVSGRLNEVIRRLVIEGVLAPTIPDRPRSRLQQYRLTVAGRARLSSDTNFYAFGGHELLRTRWGGEGGVRAEA